MHTQSKRIVYLYLCMLLNLLETKLFVKYGSNFTRNMHVCRVQDRLKKNVNKLDFGESRPRRVTDFETMCVSLCVPLYLVLNRWQPPQRKRESEREKEGESKEIVRRRLGSTGLHDTDLTQNNKNLNLFMGSNKQLNGRAYLIKISSYTRYFLSFHSVATLFVGGDDKKEGTLYLCLTSLIRADTGAHRHY
jgi:hypothetical protein